MQLTDDGWEKREKREKLPRRAGLRGAWTAQDYDDAETYIEAGMGTMEIAMLLDPPSSSTAVRCALRRAGIPLGKGKGRPSRELAAARREYVDTVLAERYAREFANEMKMKETKRGR